MLNSVLLTSAQKIMRTQAPSGFMISVRFFNSDNNSAFSFYPLIIDEIKNNQDFIGNIGDELDLTMTIAPRDYALLQDQGQDLLCVLTFTYSTKDGIMVFTPPPVRKQYHVTIIDPVDIRKQIPDVQMYTEPSAEMTVRLIEDTIYKLRHVRINTVFQNATVNQALYGVTEKLGITHLEMVPPDNTHNYDHIDISSYQGVGSVYQYLQSKFGVYEKGANSYITNGVLYVYPPFDVAPKYDRTAIFYQVDTGNFAGAPTYHTVENDNVSIIINTQPMSYDLSVAGSENVGTGFIFTRSSRGIDGFTTEDSSQGAKFTQDPSLTVTLDKSRTAVKGVNNIKHIRTTDNPYPAMSEIISHQASLMQVQWPHADPFQLDPGHAVSYYYDRNEKMVLKTGIVEHAIFTIKPMERGSAKTIYGVSATLILRLSPNETIVV